MGKYDIPTLSRKFFPWFWQNAENMSLVDVLQSSFDAVNDDLETSEQDFEERVGYSIQRLSLETGLNTRFDATLKRITVTNGEKQSQFIFNEGEDFPDWETEKYVRNEGEALGASGELYVSNTGEPFDAVAPFTVTVPISLSGQEQEIRAFIEAVLIYGTVYDLIFV
jgi:hypothetical protein